MLKTRWIHRGPKSDPDEVEKRIGSADEWSAGVSRELAGGWSLALSGNNLLDQEYFPAADRKAPLAPERSVGIHLTRTRIGGPPTKPSSHSTPKGSSAFRMSSR